jgi:hypothetical protein
MTHKTHPTKIFEVISSNNSPHVIQRELTTGEIRHQDNNFGRVAHWVEGYPPLPRQIDNDEVISRITDWTEGKSTTQYPTYGTTDIEFANHVKRLLKIIEYYRENY